MRIEIINGPNLNLLGLREPDVYGHNSFESYLERLKRSYPEIQFGYFQSNWEGALVDQLHLVGMSGAHIIINPGGYSHTSVAVADAISAITSKCIEVHISQIYQRESYRQILTTASRCIGTISGFGLNSYQLAVEAFRKLEAT